MMQWKNVKDLVHKWRAERRQRFLQRQRALLYARPTLGSPLEDRITPTGIVDTFTGGPGGGITAWTNPNGWDAQVVPGASDKAVIGAPCVLSGTETTVSALSVTSTFQLDAQLNVQATAYFDGTTTVASGGLLTVAESGSDGTGGTLSTVNLSTLSGGSSNNLVINPNGQAQIYDTGSLAGPTSVLGTLEGMNTGSSSGAIVTMTGLGTVGGTGKVQANTLADIIFAPGSAWALLSGGQLMGQSGLFNINSTLTINGTQSQAITAVMDNDGTGTAGNLSGSGAFQDWGSFTWDGGAITLSGGLVVESPATFTSTTAQAKTITSSLTNDSLTTTLGGGAPILLYLGGTLDNDLGTMTLETNITSYMGGPFLNNATLQVNGGTASSPLTISPALTSDNTTNSVINVSNGSYLSLAGGATLGGHLQVDGELDIDSTVTVATLLLDNRSSTGVLNIDSGGTLSVDSGVTLDFLSTVEVLTGGTLTGAGEVENDGRLVLNPGSTVDIGSFQQNSDGTFVSVMSMAGYGSMKVEGTAVLGGTLEVDLTPGYTPPPGTYTLLTAGTRDGTFGTAPPYQPILPPGMSVLYGPNSVSVVQS